ncbi:peptidyl-prolyl cis-trans isomerase [Acidithiobacillus sp. MC6.1]|nr:peptidyl-prolyl cis-trans isomerase [Acidithiobacillus sp. MC6.1]
MRKAVMLLSLISSTALAAPLAVVDGQPITKAQVDAANPAAKTNPTDAQSTLQTLINRTLLLQQAKKEGIEDSPSFKTALANEKSNLLIQFTVNHYLALHPITDEAIKARYAELVKTAPKEQYRLREIAIPSYQEAVAVLEDLKKGQSFSVLAADHPDSPNPTLGGELGWLSDTQIAAPILAHIRKANTGEVVGPITVPNGFVVIQVLGQRPAMVLPLKDVRPHLETDLRNQETAQYVQKLRAAAHIAMDSAPQKGKKP